MNSHFKINKLNLCNQGHQNRNQNKGCRRAAGLHSSSQVIWGASGTWKRPLKRYLIMHSTSAARSMEVAARRLISREQGDHGSLSWPRSSGSATVQNENRKLCTNRGSFWSKGRGLRLLSSGHQQSSESTQVSHHNKFMGSGKPGMLQVTRGMSSWLSSSSINRGARLSRNTEKYVIICSERWIKSIRTTGKRITKRKLPMSSIKRWNNR